MVKKSKASPRTTELPVKVSSIKPGLKCIGEVCFTDDGIKVIIPKDANPECAKATADYILGGKPVKFEIEKEGSKKKE